MTPPAGNRQQAPTPLVSVVVPTCNRRDLTRRCLEALADQTHPSYEIIVVDDGSTDGTPDMLKEFAAKHPSVSVLALVNERNIGANPSRNRGVDRARGRFVAFLDSDCIAQPDWLARLMNGFESDRVAAVTGRVDDPAPTNIYELAFKGTHRVPGAGAARRLVGGNMCVRRHLLLEHRLHEDLVRRRQDTAGGPDVTVSEGCDEEGLYLTLKAAGFEQRVVPGATVTHEHFYSRRSFFRQAFRGGRSAARLVYKYHLPPRLDMLPFVLGYGTLPFAALDVRALAVSAFFLAAALAAVAYNDLFRKGKTVTETIRSFPVLLAYYHVRLYAYVSETVRLYLKDSGIKRIKLDRFRQPSTPQSVEDVESSDPAGKLVAGRPYDPPEGGPS